MIERCIWINIQSYDVDGIMPKVLVDILKLSVQNILLGYWALNVAPYIMNI
jgi:hypothetical protein